MGKILMRQQCAEHFHLPPLRYRWVEVQDPATAKTDQPSLEFAVGEAHFDIEPGKQSQELSAKVSVGHANPRIV